MGGKYDEGETSKALRNNPGPGEYDVEAKKLKISSIKKDPEYRIGTAERFGPNRLKEFKHMPGPANYNTASATSLINRQSP